MSLDDIKKVRLEKLTKIKEFGLDPYPADVDEERVAIQSVLEKFDVLQSSAEEIIIAGRVMSIRGQGGIFFVDLYDGTGKIQIVFKKDSGILSGMFDLFVETVDMGDFIEVTGTCFVTQRGEKSVEVGDWGILTKTLQPLPEKWHGLQDVEERYRKRYLDLLVNPELKDIFVKKAKFWKATREFLENKKFLEVQTPILETTTGGAEARPFETHHNDFDIDVYLRISVGELWQKRLMAAGFPRTFEIGRVFRNEGSSPEHLQEFTNMEFYAAYMNFDEGISFTEDLIKRVVQETFGTLTFDIKGESVDLSGLWERVDYVEKIKEMTGVDVLTAGEEELKDRLVELGVRFEGENKERLTDSLWKYCRKQIMGPVWLTGHPKLVSPLSKADPNNPQKTLRVQLILAGAEMTNGFAELNNPLEQKKRFTEQAELLAAGDTEAMMPDWEFVEMLEHGMPPAFGQAYGERLFATLVGKPIRETELFPLMKPKQE
ncbi:MAG: lysine--tRNA ligase [Candidatus Zambryskibacteria bacterium CG10_big_fil_rev_8_21_14_0_10_42_12]|uniref:Lysine--tRNA ligase n=1 Tax=Candidatus Zambryskibacteria bacterium CG10_big_fil_rev_8_21_14_0_10_42_12 TaxID=1975115 RepID=A0A2H0QUE5_9BACT|nr:MAG: lysine--tRNA ligase [Candidatus Zambryskibacteria bacterium CG10_big_fil_rev_8_21_14_0_10_42_12]